jgi:hypothetical protein
MFKLTRSIPHFTISRQGAVPGPMNESRKASGNAVLIYKSSRIRFAGEIAKVRNKERAIFLERDRCSRRV